MDHFTVSLDLQSIRLQFSQAIADYFNIIKTQVDESLAQQCTVDNIKNIVDHHVARELDDFIRDEVRKCRKSITLGNFLELNKSYYDVITCETDGNFYIWDETREHLIDKCTSLTDALTIAKKYYK